MVVGLGNPGRQHENDRHNVGFLVADELQRQQGWPPFKAKFAGVWTRGSLEGEDVALLKPQTYMNLVGDSVQPAAAFLKIPGERVVAIHDELDLSFGDVRVKMGGGHAGNNGVRSLIDRLGGANFVRIRVGIGKPPLDFGGDGAAWVLSRFDPGERAQLPGIVDRAIEALRLVVKDGPAAAMNVVNTRPK